MANRPFDLRNILSFAEIYNFFQRLVGGARCRRWLVNEFIRPFPGAKVLDIGCGAGSLFEYFPPQIDYIGVDPNPDYISYAKSRYKDRAQFYCAKADDLETIEKRKGYFDFVLAIAVLHHLNQKEAQGLVQSASQYLKKGGVLITFDCVYLPHQNTLAKLIVSLDRGQNIRDPEGYSRLVSEVFPRHESHTASDLLNIPYSHFLLKCFKD